MSIYLYACMLPCFICVQLFATLWTVVHQASLSMEFSRQEYWSGLPYPPPGDILNSELNLFLLHCNKFFTISTIWEAYICTHYIPVFSCEIASV